MRFDMRILCVSLLILCTTSGCGSRHGVRGVSQCGQGHRSLLDCYLSKTHQGHHHGHGQCTDDACAEGPCDLDCYQRPPHTRGTQPGTQSAPVPPPESTTRIIRPRRRWVDRSRDSLEFSIPLPSRWIGSTESSAEISEPEETIPWDNAPVATASPRTVTADPEAPQVVGYEYGVPVELQTPRFDDGHSALNRR